MLVTLAPPATSIPKFSRSSHRSKVAHQSLMEITFGLLAWSALSARAHQGPPAGTASKFSKFKGSDPFVPIQHPHSRYGPRISSPCVFRTFKLIIHLVRYAPNGDTSNEMVVDLSPSDSRYVAR